MSSISPVRHQSLPDPEAWYDLTSFRCQCGGDLRFYDSTLDVVRSTSMTRRVELPSALGDGHVVVFEGGQATEVVCPSNG
ncbi:MAG: hypothetical protein QGG36_32290 [Pirellulaceae bacterium]|nr:hypothetical protein [Pirellulaceae bacterium]MDP7020524.1 hypothetical protein [Pirellulaceae bacterium]